MTPTPDFIELMIRYGQFCPVAKTAEIFGDRWSPLVDSRAMLWPQGVWRLPGDHSADLQNHAVAAPEGIEPLVWFTLMRRTKGRGHSYTLTAAGEAFRPMIEMMGEWGLKWGQGLIGPDDLGRSY